MCEHHESNCQLQSDCCKEIWDCRRCHNEQRSHVMGIIMSVRCKLCGHDQTPSSECNFCGVKFARYYCEYCHIYSHHDAYHCSECGRCHLGRSSMYYYCDFCRLCMPLDRKLDHKTFHEKYPSNYRSDYDVNCVICLDRLKSRMMVLLRCGHILHDDCYTEMLEHDHRCPLCYKSTLVDSDPVDDEVKDEEDGSLDMWYLYCHECERTTRVRLGSYRCGNCKTTNTRLV